MFIRVYVNIYVLLQFISMEAENIKNELACRVWVAQLFLSILSMQNLMKINRNPIRTQSYFSQQSFASLPHFQFCIRKKPRWRRQKLGVKTPTLRLLHCRSTFQTVKIHLFLEVDVAHLISRYSVPIYSGVWDTKSAEVDKRLGC